MTSPRTSFLVVARGILGDDREQMEGGLAVEVANAADNRRISRVD
jgi:hypothetical protein